MRMEHACLAIPLALIGLRGAAQDLPTADLTLADNRNGQVEVRMRVDSNFDGIISALTFTLRWPTSAGMAVDTAVRCYPFQDAVPMTATAVQTSGGYMYRTFNGFSITVLSEVGVTMLAHQEYAICTADILVPGTQVELVNDTWTDANNRSYYCSLNAVDRTGLLFPSPEPDVALHSENPGTGSLQVMLTPGSDFFGWVTSIDFTVRWPAGTGTSLGTGTQSEEVAGYLPVHRIGGEINSGGFIYQRFHGEGVKSIANAGHAWHDGQDVNILSIPIFGDGQGLMVMNDEWTAAEDADYRILLNGVDHTGPLEGIAMGLTPTAPTEITATVRTLTDGFELALELPGKATMTTLHLHNAAGQHVWNASRNGLHGRVNLVAATGALPEGLYILSVRHGERSLTRRIIR